MSESSKDAFFVRQVERWYQNHQRPLPWRKKPTPYTVWLAEIIFQQTRIEQGMSYYLRFIKKYPDLLSLAKAEEDEILRMWQGLGYYSRALNLHKTAKILVERGGDFPKTVHELIGLPGIGPYTAGAIASIAFGQRVPLVDGNVTRLFARFFGIESPVNHLNTSKNIYSKAKELVKLSDTPSNYNQGLMDMGSLLCKPAKPSCYECPLSQECSAHHYNKVEILPLKRPKPLKSNRYLFYEFIEKDGKIAVHKRDNRDIWKNLYQLPLLLDTTSTDEKTEFELRHQNLEKMTTIRHILTHQILHLTIYRAEKFSDQNKKMEIRYVVPSLLGELAFPVPFQKFFAKILT
ncbi:MAG: A/G-specific adenine glycosylase [Thermaurantimonas sp.]